MKKHKTAIVILTALTLALGVAGCAGKEDVSIGGSAQGGSQTLQEPTGPVIQDGEEMPYIAFYAERRGADEKSIDLSRAASIVWSVYECEMAYPPQRIKDPASVEAAVEMIKNVYVTSDSDGIASTEGGASLSILDAEGKEIISISLQDGKIETSDGRYEARGLATSDIPGLMYEDDWLAYSDARMEADEEYLAALQPSCPTNLFEVNGKYANDFFNECTADDIVKLYFFDGNKGKSVMERADIEKIYEALCAVEVTGEGDYSRWEDDQWSVTIVCVNGDNSFEDDVQFSFHGEVFKKGDAAYATGGADVLRALCAEITQG